MALRTLILKSFYQDSVALMRLAQSVRSLPGVEEAAALMGTPSNQDVLEKAGMASDESRSAEVNDLILAVLAESSAAAERALEAGQKMISARKVSVEEGDDYLPRTLDSALAALPDANLAAISVPGEFAGLEAQRALRRGLHVFLFSDNVPLEVEVRLKREAAGRGLLCMGPDCGTAYLNGAALGFANVISRGRAGIVAASGTGLQAVASMLSGAGEGLSQGIGVGGRDLSGAVGGEMTLMAIEALSRDPETEVIIVISKPPEEAVLPRLEAALAGAGKPAVVCCLGAKARTAGSVQWVETLEDAVRAALAQLKGEGGSWSALPFSDPEKMRKLERDVRAACDPAGGQILGLYTGGTLASEAKLLLEGLMKEKNGKSGFAVLDLGADEFTVGRPHPMIDPQVRTERILEAGASGQASVLLLDLVLGKGAHANPAAPLADAVRRARAAAEKKGRPLAAVASVVGTADDPQGFSGQVAALENAGIIVCESNAQAARFAALLAAPETAAILLEGKK